MSTFVHVHVLLHLKQRFLIQYLIHMVHTILALYQSGIHNSQNNTVLQHLENYIIYKKTLKMKKGVGMALAKKVMKQEM